MFLSLNDAMRTSANAGFGADLNLGLRFCREPAGEVPGSLLESGSLAAVPKKAGAPIPRCCRPVDRALFSW